MGKKNLSAIEVFTDAEGQHRFRIKAKNGEILVQSEGYTDVRNCKKCLDALADVLWLLETEKIEVKRV